MTIINLRGTHGSGKSTVATKIMGKYPTAADSGNKPEGYFVDLPTGELLYIVGRYETACGGCDSIQPYADIWPRVKYAQSMCHHVLFEGALISTTYGSIGEASEVFGNDFIFAFLDTPLERCIFRVNERRAAKGKEPLADPRNIEAKWHTIERLRQKLFTGAGVPRRRVELIDHTKPVSQVLKLLGVKNVREPA